MGNCLNKAAKRRQHERVMMEEENEEEGGGGSQLRRSIGQVLQEEQQEEEAEAEAAGQKVKVVLTRAELEWLMAQLKTDKRCLEDVLHQMGSARADKPPRDGWRSRLECILECPETAAGADTT